MACGIGQYQKFRKTEIDLTIPLNLLHHLQPLNSYDKLDEYTDISRKKTFTAETQYRKICAREDIPSVIIQNESASKTYSKEIFISNIHVDDDSRSFENPI